ncbi:MAG: glycosyltransferase, partial [Pseudomonadota bacterium]
MVTAALRTPESEVEPGPVPHVAFMMGNLHTGGVQRMTTLIAEGLAAQGANVDLVACDAKGGLKEHLPPSLRLIELEPSNPVGARVAVLRSDPHGFTAYLRPLLTIKYASPTLAYLPAMADYLRTSRPDSVFSATTYLNIETVLAKRLAAVPSRLVISD